MLRSAGFHPLTMSRYAAAAALQSALRAASRVRSAAGKSFAAVSRPAAPVSPPTVPEAAVTYASTLLASVDSAVLAGSPPPAARAFAASASAASTAAAGPASAGSGVPVFAVRHSAANTSTSAAAASQRLWPASTSALPTGGRSSSTVPSPSAPAGLESKSIHKKPNRISKATFGICRLGCVRDNIGIIPLQ
ncbi:hypothetical protein D3C75_816250 [compost metagenome]